MKHPDGGPQEKASLVQGSGRSYFGSIFTWQIPSYCRGLSYKRTDSLSLLLLSSRRAVGIISCATVTQQPVRLGKCLGMEWKIPEADGLLAPVKEKLCCSFREWCWWLPYHAIVCVNIVQNREQVCFT